MARIYRMSTSLKGGYTPADVGQGGGRLGDAESIYQAIMKLQENTGLFARDLHDGNAMRRPDGDIVIVDVGIWGAQKLGCPLAEFKQRLLETLAVKLRTTLPNPSVTGSV